ncbi:MAG: bifunctional [glutamate--ammonia ligase]-adenylyl-L-tyrosine phosphorylase/[glutamate--ammonia-ligase] adenylyltransferase [Pseudohongiellaceae bacterium]
MQGTELLPKTLQPAVQRYWERARQQGALSHPPLAALLADSAVVQKINRVWACSDFVANATIGSPELLVRTICNETRFAGVLERLRKQLEPLSESGYAESGEELKRILRRFHRQEFVEILWCDLLGEADLYRTCRRVTVLADACLHACIELLQQWSVREWGRPVISGEGDVEQTLVIIAMGKLGASELNVSSDIDLIFTYPENGGVDRSPTNGADDALTNHQFFIRLGQRLIDALDTTTEDGFVFRVDMRLRPYGSEGALVQSFDALEDYYQSQGRDWERYAMVKARIAAGDVDRGRQLLRRLRPFVYRKYLDFAMFESLREMKTQINRQARNHKLDTDIKLGRGGIREVEFVVQALQLVHGGRDRTLRCPSTRKALAGLREGNYLPVEATDELALAYEYLRNLEHRIQSISNQQTQELPADEVNRARLAYAMNHHGWEGLEKKLGAVRDIVHTHFREVINIEGAEAAAVVADEGGTHDWSSVWKQPADNSSALSLLKKSGFEDPDAVLKQIDEFKKDRKYLLASQDGRKRFDQFMPVLLAATAESRRPSLCFARIMTLIEAVSRRTAYLVLLLENPGALQQLVKYCTESLFIADYLARYPVLLDELLDVIDTPPERISLHDELRTQLLRIDESSFEEQLECLRYFKQSHILQVAAAEISGKLPIMKVSDYLTYTAEVILDRVLALSWQHLVDRHGFPVHADGQYGEPDFAIIGYGKVGGIELGYNSDLDLVFLHRASLEEETIAVEGQRRINSREFYIRLAQRIILVLGTYTTSGKLYEADMRLRPSGESGLLVSSLDSFKNYQQTNAWTWEHQALVRARGIVGNADLLAEFHEVRHDVLSRKRDTAVLAGEVLDMRRKMRDGVKKKLTGIADKLAFAIKHEPGGIIDIEFLVQYLVLAHSVECDELTTYTDNMRILEAIQHCRLLKQSSIDALMQAYLVLRSASHSLAIQQAEDIPTEKLSAHQQNVVEIWDDVFGVAR